MEAKRVRSIRRRSRLEANKHLQLETEGVTVRDSALNFNIRKRYIRLSSVAKPGSADRLIAVPLTEESRRHVGHPLYLVADL